ncbi:MAG: hypothetical protein J6X53_07225, partial [Abditibacteriota bacterium]|nr:hypothetical protein [Abditibacteriota bacterium]
KAAKNYRTFVELFPEIANGEYRYLRLEVNGETGYMPVHVQWIDDDVIALSHTHIVNGDMMNDPEMTFRVDREKGTLEPLTYQQDNLGIYQQVYPAPGKWIPALRRDLNAFSEGWLDNISHTPYVKKRAVMEIDGEDVEIFFDEHGNRIPDAPEPIIPEETARQPEPIQDTAEKDDAPRAESETQPGTAKTVSGPAETVSGPPETVSESEETAQKEKPVNPPDSIKSPNCTPLEFLPYKAGDTVYLWDLPYTIREINGDYIGLKTVMPNSRKPYSYTERRSDFEEKLQLDGRNNRFTDFLPANLNKANLDLCEILTLPGGLFSESDKEKIAGLFHNNNGNGWIVRNLASSYSGQVNTLPLVTGEQADYFANENGVEIGVQDKYATKLYFSWDKIVPILRAMYQQNLYGFHREPVEVKKEQTAPQPSAPAQTTPENSVPAQAASKTGQKPASVQDVLDLPIGTKVNLENQNLLLIGVNRKAGEVELQDLNSPRKMLPMVLVWSVETLLKRLETENAAVILPETSAPEKHTPEKSAAPEQSETVTGPETASPQGSQTEPFLIPNVDEYLKLKAQYPDKLVGVEIGELVLFYGKDAEAAGPALGANVLTREIPGLGETSVTGSGPGWAAVLRNLLTHCHSAVMVGPSAERREDPNAPYEVYKERNAKDFLPLGKEIMLDGRRMIIDSVNFDTGKVSLRDGELQGWYPVFRTENIPFVRGLVEKAEEQEWKKQVRDAEVNLMLETAEKAAREAEQTGEAANVIAVGLQFSRKKNTGQEG